MPKLLSLEILKKYSSNAFSKLFFDWLYPKVKKSPNNFSFSGIKTALLYKYKNMTRNEINNNLNHLAASYQEVILDTLFDKLLYALNIYNVKMVSIVGGVSNNKYISEKF